MSVTLQPARFSDRLVAYLIDTTIFVLAAVITLWVYSGPFRGAPTSFALALIGICWFALAVVWQFFGNWHGATLGKKILGLEVVTPEGVPPNAWRALVRTVGWVFSTPLANFGFLWALVHPQSRTLHDLISGTYVVEKGPRRSNGAVAFFLSVVGVAVIGSVHLWSVLLRPTEADLAAVARAREGLSIIARIEERYKSEHGTYTDSLPELAEASGDTEVFRTAMLEVFSPTPFFIEAGNKGWRVTAAAKDRRRTRVYTQSP